MPRSGHVEFVIRFRGGSFESWKAAFEKHEPARIRHGAVGHWIARSIDDHNEFIAVVEFTSVGGARGYAGTSTGWMYSRRCCSRAGRTRRRGTRASTRPSTR